MWETLSWGKRLTLAPFSVEVHAEKHEARVWVSDRNDDTPHHVLLATFPDTAERDAVGLARRLHATLAVGRLVAQTAPRASETRCEACDGTDEGCPHHGNDKVQVMCPACDLCEIRSATPGDPCPRCGQPLWVQSAPPAPGYVLSSGAYTASVYPVGEGHWWWTVRLTSNPGVLRAAEDRLPGVTQADAFRRAGAALERHRQ